VTILAVGLVVVLVVAVVVLPVVPAVVLAVVLVMPLGAVLRLRMVALPIVGALPTVVGVRRLAGVRGPRPS
jgi:hypothetical protein